jgi:hypothetical protein
MTNLLILIGPDHEPIVTTGVGGAYMERALPRQYIVCEACGSNKPEPFVRSARYEATSTSPGPEPFERTIVYRLVE